MDLFNLEEVIALGGDEDDFNLLLNVDGKSKEDPKADVKCKVSIEDLKSEVTALVNELGITPEQSLEACIATEDLEEKKSQTKVANETAIDVKAILQSLSSEKNHSHLTIAQDERWYNQIPSDFVSGNNAIISGEDVTKLSERGNEYLEKEVLIYQTARKADKSSDSQWLSTVFKSGTLGDKVAAHSMLVQESSIHNRQSLQSLLAMTKKKGKRECLSAIDSLKHLWVECLLPDRKLYSLKQNLVTKLAQLDKDKHSKVIALWCYEDYLKEQYKQFIDIVQSLAQDSLANIRIKVLGTISHLLTSKPEEEQRLLTMIINKLGDPDRHVASKASFYLSKLVSLHPNMTMTVVGEVERLLYRSNIADKAQYYAICYLNQLVLSHKQRHVADKLINIYFGFFKSMARDSDANTKMLSALISGVNRAFPYASGDTESIEEQVNVLFHLSHARNLTTSVQALMLLFQVMNAKKSLSDRYYQCLYAKLFEHDLSTSLKLPMFLNLLYKSMKSDPVIHRLRAFVKRILQTCDEEQPAYSCAALYLVSEVTKVQPALKSLVSQSEEVDEEEHFYDVTLDDDKAKNVKSQPSSTKMEYDVMHRNPLYCGAQYACAWEMNALSKHYHPSVSHFTHSLIHEEAIQYTGDPLQDFTLKRFLDRFTYKNPKKVLKARGNSVMQPQYASSRMTDEPVNSSSFINQSEEKVPVDELFYHKYFKQRQHENESKKTKRKASLADRESQWLDEVENTEESKQLDFASNIERMTSLPSKKKKKDDDDDDDDELSEEEYNYSDLDAMSSEEEDFDEDASTPGKKKNWSDHEYEKALLDNLSSESENDDSDGEPKMDYDNEALFASAEQFSHLLDDAADASTISKQDKWELSRQVPTFKEGKKIARKHQRPKKNNLSGTSKKFSKPMKKSAAKSRR